MLIGRKALTPDGIELVDVDGSRVKINAEDALELAKWIRANPQYGYLLEIVRQQERTVNNGEERNS
jgi:hypothetical protein